MFPYRAVPRPFAQVAQSVTGCRSSASRRAVDSSTQRLAESTWTTRGSKELELRFFVVRIGDDDHLVTAVYEPRSRTVQADLARASDDRVRLEASPVVDVEHSDLFVLADVGELSSARDRD